MGREGPMMISNNTKPGFKINPHQGPEQRVETELVAAGPPSP